MNANLAAILYLVACVLLILSLRGPSTPPSTRRRNFMRFACTAVARATRSGRMSGEAILLRALHIDNIRLGKAVGVFIRRGMAAGTAPHCCVITTLHVVLAGFLGFARGGPEKPLVIRR